MGANNFSIRPAEDRDKKVLLDIYNRTFKPVRTVEEWNWEFRNPPGAPPVHHVICLEDAAIGQMIVLPMYMIYKGTKILTGRTQALVVRKKYRFVVARKKLVNSLIQSVVKESNEKGIKILWGFPMEHAVPTFEKNGFVTSKITAMKCDLTVKPKVVKYFNKINKTFHVDCNLASTLFGKIKITKIPFVNSNTEVSLFRTSDASSVENTWELLKKRNGLFLDRNKEFIAWRYIHNPYHQNEIYIIRKSGSDIGFVIFGYKNEGVLRKGYIVDWVMNFNDSHLVNNVWKKISCYLTQRGVDQVVIWSESDNCEQFTIILNKVGFKKRSVVGSFNYQAVDNVLNASSFTGDHRWAIPMALMEGTSF